MENKPRRHIHIFWPLLLIAVGVFLFLNNLGILPGTTVEILLKLWPLLFILGGVEGFINREGTLWPVLITGLGVIFLLSNFGQLSVPVWTALARLWPVLLIALGLNLIVGHHKGWLSAVLGIVIGLILVASVYLLAVNAPALGGARSETISIPAEGITEASGEIRLPVGKLTLSAGDDPDALVAGNVTLSKGETLRTPFTQTGDPGSFSIKSSGANYVFSLDSGTYTWNLAMSKEIDYTDLEVEVYTGEISADLSKLQVADFTFKLPVGKVTLAVPEQGEFNGTIDAAVGQVILCVPSDMALRIHLDPAVTIVNVDDDFTRQGNQVTTKSNFAAGETVSVVTIKLPVGIIFIHDISECDLQK